MDRLLRPHVTDKTSCPHRGCNKCDCYRKQLEEYKDAEEQGLLLRLPCKVGDTVYIVVGKDISRQNVVEIRISSGNGTEFITNRRIFHKSEFGKTVFLAREEAESALAEKGGV